MSGARQSDRPGDEVTIDELLSALADARRRAVIRYFHDTLRVTATAEELAEELAGGGVAANPERLATVLHHASLPKLDKAGIVEYDPATRTARYRGEELRDPVRRLVDDVTAVVTA